MSAKAVAAAIERNAARKRRSLRLNNRRLTAVPESLCSLDHLEHLELYRNRLSELPTGFADLVQLRHLDLSDNEFERLPDALFELMRLETLLLVENTFRELPARIARLTHLKTLLLGGPIASIATELGSLVQLEHLRIRASGDLPVELGNLTNLRFLDLADSSLDRFPDWIMRLQRLEVLVLRGCGLTAVPDSIRNLQNLESIDLGGNDLASIPDGLFDIPSLRGLDLHENPNLPILELPLDRLPNLTQASQGALGEWFLMPGDDGDLEIFEDREHDAPFLERAFFIGAGRGFIGLMTTNHSVWLVHSSDGETWTKMAPPDFEGLADASVTLLWHTGDWWITALATATTDRKRTTDPKLALSGDAVSWHVLDLSSHLREDEGLSISAAAVSGSRLIVLASRAPRSGRETSVLLVGPITGPLHEVKAPLSHVGDVVALPSGFVIACPTQRGGERTRLFDSPDGDRWTELDPLVGYRSLHRVADVLLGEADGLVRSTDWGRTWTAAQDDFGLRDSVVMNRSAGPAGLALEVVGRNDRDRMESSVWFSNDGRRFARLHTNDPRAQPVHTRLIAVAEDHVLLQSCDLDGDGSTEWIRIPTAGF